MSSQRTNKHRVSHLPTPAPPPASAGTRYSPWHALVVVMMMVLVPWALYLTYDPRFSSNVDHVTSLGDKLMEISPATALGQIENSFDLKNTSRTMLNKLTQALHDANTMNSDSKSNFRAVEATKLAILHAKTNLEHSTNPVPKVIDIIDDSLPVLGPVPTDGAKPLYGVKHNRESDAIFALACNYPKEYYQRFVGSLRKFGYHGDIVLAVSPLEKMKPGVSNYLQATKVVAYGFDVDCQGKDNCKLRDDFLGYPDPRPHRTFANIRYALYEYWLRNYGKQSYILILDFRDTFFQDNPFRQLLPVTQRPVEYDLRVFAENWKVKNIGICVYNSLWIGRCFGKEALEQLKSYPVLCSGSTMGSYTAIHQYIRTMLSSMDSVKCWLKGIESDQGYQNYLYYNGKFNSPTKNATLYYQGDGVVNTIGALNGHRVPKDQKGPLDTFWKIRDKEGYILNNDGSRSACVHQWDRWYGDVVDFVDTKLYDPSI